MEKFIENLKDMLLKANNKIHWRIKMHVFDMKSNLFKVSYKPWIRIANLTFYFKKVCLVQIMP